MIFIKCEDETLQIQKTTIAVERFENLPSHPSHRSNTRKISLLDEKDQEKEVCIQPSRIADDLHMTSETVVPTKADEVQAMRLFEVIETIPEIPPGVIALIARAKKLLKDDLPKQTNMRAARRGEAVRVLADNMHPGWRSKAPGAPSARDIAREFHGLAKKIKINREYFCEPEISMKQILELSAGVVSSFETFRKDLK